MDRLDNDFIKQLGNQHKIDKLENHSGSVYGIWSNFQLAYLNPAWFDFAVKNNGNPEISNNWGLGKSVLDCVSGQLHYFYKTIFTQCLYNNTLWSHEYECSSDTIYRRFHQLVYPLENQQGLLIVNSIIVEQAHSLTQDTITAFNINDYLDDNNFICQCAYCRRVENFQHSGRWDWIPEWVKNCPKNTSHTYCPDCFDQYFHKALDEIK